MLIYCALPSHKKKVGTYPYTLERFVLPVLYDLSIEHKCADYHMFLLRYTEVEALA